GVQAAWFRMLPQCLAVRHGEAHFQVIPVLRLTDAAYGWEIPFHFITQTCLGEEFFAAEQAAGVVPLTTCVDDLPTRMELHGTANGRSVANLLHDLGSDGRRLVAQLIGLLQL